MHRAQFQRVRGARKKEWSYIMVQLLWGPRIWSSGRISPSSCCHIEFVAMRDRSRRTMQHPARHPRARPSRGDRESRRRRPAGAAPASCPRRAEPSGAARWTQIAGLGSEEGLFWCGLTGGGLRGGCRAMHANLTVYPLVLWQSAQSSHCLGKSHFLCTQLAPCSPYQHQENTPHLFSVTPSTSCHSNPRSEAGHINGKQSPSDSLRLWSFPQAQDIGPESVKVKILCVHWLSHRQVQSAVGL